MSVIPEPNALELIRWMEVPQQPNVFTLGNFARQVTFSSQQTRAFSLIWALFRANRLASGRRVAVVGAGLGGITAAVAALAKECYVDLYEQASQACPLQRGNDIRFIHPNILRWPEEGSETAHTDFPFLNWTAASVRGVIKQIDLQWKRHVTNTRLRRLFNYHVSRLYVSPSKAGPQRPWITANRVIDGTVAGDDAAGNSNPGFIELPYDCVILAVGFGEERSVIGVPFVSYWENDSLHQETGRGRRSIFVSGCGDGGLIDALRLRLRNFDHADFVRRFLGVAQSSKLISRLQKVENELRRQASAPDVSLRFQARYDAIAVPKEVEKYFCDEKRSDTTVTLNSPAPGPLTFKASLLNRYATYLAVRYADLHYLSGRIVAERAAGGGYHVIVRRDDIGLDETHSFDMVIVRHGPQGVISRLIPNSAMGELATWWEKNDDITTKALWRNEDAGKPHRFFKEFEVEPVPSNQEALDLALATYDSAFREFSRDGDVLSVAVGKHDDKAGFIVTLNPEAKQRQSRFYAGVLVQFVHPPGTAPAPTPTPTAVARPVVPPGERIASIGAGIYNYTAQQRLIQSRTNGTGVMPAADASGAGDFFTSGVGTLGCFATDSRGVLHLISSGNVLSPARLGKRGDKIFLEGQSPKRGHRPIATLAAWRLPRSAQKIDYVDVAAARLESGVHPDYGPLLPLRINRAGQAIPGNEVIKVGRTSTFTEGKVVGISQDIRMTTWNSEPVLLHDCIIITGVVDTDFSLAGDSGAVIVRKDGTAVGLLVGASMGTPGHPGVTVACSFERALQELKLSLRPSQRAAPTRPRASSRGKRKSAKS